MTLDELIMQGQTKIDEHNRAVAEQQAHEAAARDERIRDEWDRIRAAAESLLPECLHPYIQYGRQDESPSRYSQPISIHAPGCVPVDVTISWDVTPPASPVLTGDKPFRIYDATLNEPYYYSYDPDLDPEDPPTGPWRVVTNDHPTRFHQVDVALAAARYTQAGIDQLQAEADDNNAAYWADYRAQKAKMLERAAQQQSEPPQPVDHLVVAVDREREGNYDAAIAHALIVIAIELRGARVDAAERARD